MANQNFWMRARIAGQFVAITSGIIVMIGSNVHEKRDELQQRKRERQEQLREQKQLQEK